MSDRFEQLPARERRHVVKPDSCARASQVRGSRRWVLGRSHGEPVLPERSRLILPVSSGHKPAFSKSGNVLTGLRLVTLGLGVALRDLSCHRRCDRINQSPGLRPYAAPLEKALAQRLIDQLDPHHLQDPRRIKAHFVDAVDESLTLQHR